MKWIETGSSDTQAKTNQSVRKVVSEAKDNSIDQSLSKGKNNGGKINITF